MYGIDYVSRRQCFLQELQNSRPAWLSPVCTVPLHYYNDKCSVIVPRSLFIMQPFGCLDFSAFWIGRFWNTSRPDSPEHIYSGTVSVNELLLCIGCSNLRTYSGACLRSVLLFSLFQQIPLLLVLQATIKKRLSEFQTGGYILPIFILTFTAVVCYNRLKIRVSDSCVI